MAAAAAVSFSRSRKPKVKWTNQMSNDVLECKRRAQELVASDSAPLNRNGRKKGYIEVMKQLWEEKGYGHLALKVRIYVIKRQGWRNVKRVWPMRAV